MATTYTAPGVYVEQAPPGVTPISGVGTSTAAFIGWMRENTSSSSPSSASTPTPTPTASTAPTSTAPTSTAPTPSPATLSPATPTSSTLTPTTSSSASPVAPVVEPPVFCNHFKDFLNRFGDFSADEGQSLLAHAVYGFFNNGGRRCVVMRVAGTSTSGLNLPKDRLDKALSLLEAIDEVALVAAPGLTHNKDVADALLTHCNKMKDRFAILDAAENFNPDTDAGNLKQSDLAALYYPWLAVYDPASKKSRFVPPSGHMAGIYARVDGTRGVHRAPANEPVFGISDLKVRIGRPQQEAWNPKGINCIRLMNGSFRVWGARTLGDNNGEYTYVNVRRTFLYLRESIERGVQWAVFEPNTPELWARLRRDLNNFLRTAWASGALFGSTPEEAFFVKCDAETNPPEKRDLGRVSAVVGVALVRPAEFVTITLGQWTPPN